MTAQDKSQLEKALNNISRAMLDLHRLQDQGFAVLASEELSLVADTIMQRLIKENGKEIQ